MSTFEIAPNPCFGVGGVPGPPPLLLAFGIARSAKQRAPVTGVELLVDTAAYVIARDYAVL
jgi:hypothetical protein